MRHLERAAQHGNEVIGVLVPVVRWVKWRSKRHALAEDGTKTLCGYEPGPHITPVVQPLVWRDRDNWPAGSSWFRDNPKHYCGICLRITGYVS